jgi:hypothetical protein
LHGTNELVVHFGTGDATALAVRVHFQSSAVEEITGIEPGNTVVVEEPEITSINDFPGPIPSRMLIARAYPNPFNSTTTITISGDKGEYYQIDIYNILGEKIRSEKVTNYFSSQALFTWDGRDSSGRYVKSGLYFARIFSNSQKANLKILLLK